MYSLDDCCGILFVQKVTEGALILALGGQSLLHVVALVTLNIIFTSAPSNFTLPRYPPERQAWRGELGFTKKVVDHAFHARIGVVGCARNMCLLSVGW